MNDRAKSVAAEEARSWVLRLASGQMTEEEAVALRNWHGASPAHREAFAHAKVHWKTLGDATRHLAAESPSGVQRDRRAVSRRWMLGAGLAAAAVGAGVVVLQPPFDMWSPLIDLSADYHTGTGEIKTVAIGNTATVQMSTRSRLSLQAQQPEGVRMGLLAGEATVAANSGQVTVTTPGGEASCSAGRFNVRLDEGTTRITCLEGLTRVMVGGSETELAANWQIRYSAQKVSTPVAADVETMTSWQRGLLVFRNQPLRVVIDEVNRYRPGKIIVVNRELGNRHVAFASFHLDRLDEVIPQMKALYRASTSELPGGVVLFG